jgi:hypothetical protein
MHYRFPYFEDRPHVPVTLGFGDNKARFLPLLDTGADFSVFYRSDAIRLGLNWDAGKTKEFHNADGSVFCAKEFELNMAIEEFTFKSSICFAENTNCAMPLLGRKGVLENFFITLCEQEKYLEIFDEQQER